MDENERKQQLSVAYLHAVASAAGFACQTPGVDDDSVDRTVVARGWVHEQALLRSPKIDVQLKSMTRAPLAVGEGSFTYRLRKKNYDDLRHRTMVPRLLVVLLLPRDRSQWIEQNDERLLSRYAAHYVSLAGMPEASQRGKVPVVLSRKNLLSVENLHRLMVRASQRTRKLS
jgi:hypothetical protein